MFLVLIISFIFLKFFKISLNYSCYQGPIRCLTKWQRDNMHYPRHQNCGIQILEQMERNGVILDEDFVRLTIKIFGDWTHVVRKAKRQLYWLPKFKNFNPYPIP